MHHPDHARAIQGARVTNLIRLESYKVKTAAKTKRIRVLVVDDESSMVRLLHATLDKIGHELMDVANNGQQAIEKAIKRRPDLILMDINIPEMDGVDAAKVILAEHACPLIFMSGLSVDETLERVRSVKAQGYLVKPFSPEQLRSAIDMAIHGFRRTSNAESEIALLRSELDTQKALEAAIARMQSHYGQDRERSMQQLQAMAKTRHCSLAEVARQTIAMLDQQQAGGKYDKDI